MRFIKFKFRPKNIIVLSLATAFIFMCQYFTIKHIAKESDINSAKILDKLSKQCRDGNQKSCQDYQTYLYSLTKES